MIPSPMLSFTFTMVKFCVNTVTCPQYRGMSANITLPPQEELLSTQHLHVDKTIPNSILQKDTGLGKIVECDTFIGIILFDDSIKQYDSYESTR